MADPVRDYSIFRAAVAALEATGDFARVLIGERPTGDQTQVAAFDVPAAILVPGRFDEIDPWDDAADVQSERTVHFDLVLIARDQDADARVESLDRLGQVAAKAIGGRSVGGFTLPGKTRIRRGTWLAAREPEKHLVLAVETSYLIDGFSAHDDDPFTE